jgi:transposase
MVFPSRGPLEWLEDTLTVLVAWPWNSPDLSTIELLRAVVKKLVRRTAPKSIESLNNVRHVAWRSIPQATLDKLC